MGILAWLFGFQAQPEAPQLSAQPLLAQPSSQLVPAADPTDRRKSNLLSFGSPLSSAGKIAAAWLATVAAAAAIAVLPAAALALPLVLSAAAAASLASLLAAAAIRLAVRIAASALSASKSLLATASRIISSRIFGAGQQLPIAAQPNQQLMPFQQPYSASFQPAFNNANVQNYQHHFQNYGPQNYNLQHFQNVPPSPSSSAPSPAISFYNPFHHSPLPPRPASSATSIASSRDPHEIHDPSLFHPLYALPQPPISRQPIQNQQPNQIWNQQQIHQPPIPPHLTNPPPIANIVFRILDSQQDLHRIALCSELYAITTGVPTDAVNLIVGDTPDGIAHRILSLWNEDFDPSQAAPTHPIAAAPAAEPPSASSFSSSTQSVRLDLHNLIGFVEYFGKPQPPSENAPESILAHISIDKLIISNLYSDMGFSKRLLRKLQHLPGITTIHVWSLWHTESFYRGIGFTSVYERTDASQTNPSSVSPSPSPSSIIDPSHPSAQADTQSGQPPRLRRRKSRLRRAQGEWGPLLCWEKSGSRHHIIGPPTASNPSIPTDASSHRQSQQRSRPRALMPSSSSISLRDTNTTDHASTTTSIYTHTKHATMPSNASVHSASHDHDDVDIDTHDDTSIISSHHPSLRPRESIMTLVGGGSGAYHQ